MKHKPEPLARCTSNLISSRSPLGGQIGNDVPSGPQSGIKSFDGIGHGETPKSDGPPSYPQVGKRKQNQPH